MKIASTNLRFVLDLNMKDKNEKIILIDEFLTNRTLLSSLGLFSDFILSDDVNIFNFSELSNITTPFFIFYNKGKERFQKCVENWLM